MENALHEEACTDTTEVSCYYRNKLQVNSILVMTENTGKAECEAKNIGDECKLFSGSNWFESASLSCFKLKIE